MRTIAITLAVCLSAAWLPAAERLPIGSRVRATGVDGLKVEGTLTAYGLDHLSIRTAGGRDDSTLAIASLERLQVAAGRDRMAGLVYGALVGVGLAVATALGAGSGDCGYGACILYAYVVGFVTVPVGALVGAAAAPRAWRDLALPVPASAATNGFRLQVAPARNGVRIGLSYGF